MPRRQAEKCVGADDQSQSARRRMIAQFLECRHRVASTRAMDLAGVRLEARMSRDGSLDHGEPVRRGGHRRGPVRWIAGRNEANRREPECQAELASKLQVPAMNRIESAAKDAEDRIHRRAHCSAGGKADPPPRAVTGGDR